MYKFALTAAAAVTALAVTPTAHADVTGMHTEVSFAQCIYTNRQHTEYTTTQNVSVTNYGTSMDRARVTVTTNGKVTRTVYVVLSQLGRVDLFVPVREGQIKDVTVKYTGGYSEVFRLRHRASCGN